MCGRYVSASSPQEIAEYFGAATVAPAEPSGSEPAPEHQPNFNVAPTTTVPIVRAAKDTDGAPQGPVLQPVRWGLIPSWAKSKGIGAKMINARSETVTTKNAFRAAVKRRRCIVPADAFYEWTAVPHPHGGKPAKQPWCIQRRDGDMLAFAGLYEVWRDPEDPDADPLYTCTILTREANQTMAPIHDRMPVMLAPDRWADWLDPADEDAATLLASIPPVPDELLTVHAVSTAVNNSRSRGEQLLDEVEPMAVHPDA